MRPPRFNVISTGYGRFFRPFLPSCLTTAHSWCPILVPSNHLTVMLNYTMMKENRKKDSMFNLNRAGFELKFSVAETDGLYSSTPLLGFIWVTKIVTLSPILGQTIGKIWMSEHTSLDSLPDAHIAYGGHSEKVIVINSAHCQIFI